MASKKKAHRCRTDCRIAAADAVLRERRIVEIEARVAELEARLQPIERVHSMRTP